ncbi:hypothetical protein ON010_g16153 [Phytophthora cinnamomi]|nr:hypothetical protein ON010_g16153 [Phytophthora cinnamomi]
MEIASFLLVKGAAVDPKSSDGRTALFLAAEEGHFDIVRALLDNGAAINIVDAENQTPLMKAAYRDHDSPGRIATEIARLNCRNKARNILQRYQAKQPNNGQ